MPRATSEKLTRLHAPSAASGKGKEKAGSAKSSSNGSSGGGAIARDPLHKLDLYGQHFLHAQGTCQAIVTKANLRSTDTCLEVGPGLGALTKLILPQVKKLTAIEMDPRMAAEVQKQVQGRPEQKKLDIIVGDAIKVDFPFFDVFISNTPYAISSPLVFKILSQRPLCRVAILMFQREFALRLVARPGDNLWCRLSANVQLYSKCDHVMKVSKSSFRPPPNVESSVVRIVPHDPPPPIRFEEFDGLTRILFQRRNKHVRANFGAKGVKEMLEANHKSWCAQQEKMLDPDFDISTKLEEIFEESGFAESRAAKMDVDDFLSLLSIFHKHGIHFGG